jgi:hypothetical protein
LIWGFGGDFVEGKKRMKGSGGAVVVGEVTHAA